MKRKKIKCALADCDHRSIRPFCDWHMAMLEQPLRDRVMGAYLATINRIGTSSDPVRIYSNLLEVARKKIAEKRDEQKANQRSAQDAQGVLL